MADNTVLNQNTTVGETFPSRSDTAGLNWPAGLAAYTLSGSAAGNWVLQYVDPTHGLPVQPQTGAAFPVTDNGGSLTVDGTVGISGSVAVTGTFWQATQPVSVATIPSHDVTNAGTFAVQAAQAGTWNVTNISGTVSLPTGAATAAKQPAIGTAGTASADVITVQGIASMTALKVDGSAVTQPVSGTVTANQGGTWNVGTVTTITSLTQMNGQAIAMGTGVRSAGTQRVTIATDDVVPASQSGTWNIGTVTTLTGITNVVHVDDNSGSLTVDNAGTFAVQATQAGTWTVQPGNTANTTPWLTNDRPATSGGLSMSKTVSAASTNATSVKASAGQVYDVQVFNTNASPRYLKLYDKASAPTVGTDTPVKTILIPGNTAGAGVVKNWDKGLAFASGIAFALTTGVADADTGAVAASEIVVNIDYK